MRFILTLLVGTFLSTFVSAQQLPPAEEPSPNTPAAPASTPGTDSSPSAEPSPTPTPAPVPVPAADPAAASDQDFINLPQQSGGVDSGASSGTEIPIANDMPTLQESDQDFVEPNDLMPADGAGSPPIDPRTLAASGEEQERKLNIRYKEIRLKAEKDPSVATLLDKAKTASTFEGERAAYREYYRTLFRKMKKLDNLLAKKCDLMEKTYLSRLAQTRIEPTIPLEPPPTPKPLANQ